MQKKILIVLATIILAVLAITGLLFYYQKQGLVNIIPTAQEQTVSQLLKIDKSKFKPAEGESEADFQKEIEQLEVLRDQLKNDNENAALWFTYASSKHYLNDHEGAVAAWEYAFTLAPSDFRIPLNLGNTYQYFLKKTDLAEANYLKALEIRPDLTLAYQGLMDLYMFNWKEKSDKYEPLMLDAIQKDAPNKRVYIEGLIDFFVRSDLKDLSKAKKYLADLKVIDSNKANELIAAFPELN